MHDSKKIRIEISKLILLVLSIFVGVIIIWSIFKLPYTKELYGFKGDTKFLIMTKLQSLRFDISILIALISMFQFLSFLISRNKFLIFAFALNLSISYLQLAQYILESQIIFTMIYFSLNLGLSVYFMSKKL